MVRLVKHALLALLLTITAAVAQQQSPLYTEALRAFQAQDYDQARMLFESVVSTEPKNLSAQNYLRIIAARQKSGTVGLQATLKQVILPKVSLNDASAREAVDYIAQQVAKQSNGAQKMSVVWMVPEDYPARVTLDLQSIPASEALRYVTDNANLQVAYDSYAVKISPAVK